MIRVGGSSPQSVSPGLATGDRPYDHLAMAKQSRISEWSISRLAAALKRAEQEAETYRAELMRQLQIGQAAASGTGSAARSTRPRPTRRRKGRKLVDDAKIVTELKKAGKKGASSGDLSKQFGLKTGQMSAVLQRLAAAKQARSNGKRGKGGRWFAA